LGAPRLLPVPSAWWETPAVTSRTLAPQPESAGTARHFTREILSSWGLGRLVNEAETIVGELVVNAVQHGTCHTASNGRRPRPAWAAHLTDAGQPNQPNQPDRAPALRLCLLRRAGEVMLAVIDASDDAPVPRRPDWAKESGRGLQIVNALASVWGWSPIEGRGKAVWAVLPF
jgi:hypothetical protein